MRDILHSIYVGFGLFLMFMVFAPITALWVVGERYQGRSGFELGSSGDPTLKGVLLALFTPVDIVIWAAVIGQLRALTP